MNDWREFRLKSPHLNRCNLTPVNYFWTGERLSEMELLTLHACRHNGHLPTLWTYDTIKNIPPFVKVERASQLLPTEFFVYYRDDLKMPPANIADVFRYELLHQVGGVYSDTDVVILKSLDELELPNFFSSTYEYGFGECANNCFMRLQPGSVITAFLTEECKRRIGEIEKVGIENVDYCFIGPFLVQECAAKMAVPMLSFDRINPISWRFVDKLIAFEKPDYKFLFKNSLRRLFPGVEKRGYFVTKESVAVHLFNEMWKKSGLDKTKTLHTGSLYEKLKKRYV